jgi:hypothetical protein
VLERLFPRRLDNDYRGHPLALWVFFPITAITIVRSLIHLFRADGGAQSIATIPLDSFTAGGSATVILIFALWGLSQLLLGFLYTVVLWRYRALLPLMYVLLIVEYVGRFALGMWKPIATLEAPPGASANYVFAALGSAMLLLALRGRAEQGAPEAASAQPGQT